MTIKRKAPPPNSLEYLWNEFLFTRPFSLELSLPPEQCVTALERLPGTVSISYGQPDRRFVTVRSAEYGSGYRFRAEHQRQNRKSHSYTTTILAEGSILSGEFGGTIVSGTALFAPSNYILSIGIVVALCLLFVAPANYGGLMGLLMLGAMGGAWWLLYQERNAVIESIRLLLNDAERMDHLVQTKPKEAHADVWADSFPSQKAKH